MPSCKLLCSTNWLAVVPMVCIQERCLGHWSSFHLWCRPHHLCAPSHAPSNPSLFHSHSDPAVEAQSKGLLWLSPSQIPLTQP